MRVLICGGGVIGTAIAYFLSRRGAKAIVVERGDVACAAPGKSGGFLARDWCDGTPLPPLGARRLVGSAPRAEEGGASPRYRRRDSWPLFWPPGPPARVVRADCSLPLSWFAAWSAGVHPARLARALMRAAEAQGAELRIGKVSGVLCDQRRQSVVGLQVDGEQLLGDAVVIAMGPWSILAAGGCRSRRCLA